MTFWNYWMVSSISTTTTTTNNNNNSNNNHNNTTTTTTHNAYPDNDVYDGDIMNGYATTNVDYDSDIVTGHATSTDCTLMDNPPLEFIQDDSFG